MISKTDAAYTAGYIDGEAYIGLYEKPRVNPVVIIGCVFSKPLEWLEERFGGNTLIDYRSSKLPNSRMCYRWRLSSAPRIKILMETIQPYVIVKKRQVDLMLEFLSTGYGEGRRGPLSYLGDEEYLRRAEIYAQFRVLNKTGVWGLTEL